MNILYALLLIVQPVAPDGTLGRDEVFALDGALASYDCFAEALSTERAAAASMAFGKGYVVGFACVPDLAPETWGK